ncbi:MAG: CAP domain-containing protein [Ruminococcus sp.]|nr:CAP domain-containing protein [Ruminococcus sp.]
MHIKTLFKKLKVLSFATAAIIAVNPLTISAYELNSPTQQQIIDMYNQHPFTTIPDTTYDESYSLSVPYGTGSVTLSTQEQALNAVNFCRYVAGLPADLQLNSEYTQKAQTGSLVNAVNDVLSHYPTQPEGMSDDMFNLGYDGTSHSNIASGFYNLPQSIIEYMDDSDTYNIGVLGHRRWVLNPKMQKTGFGMVGKYAAMYAIDRTRQQEFTGDYVCWPGKNMPYELYDTIFGDTYAFSVTLGNRYDTPALADVQVTVTSTKLNKTWNLDSTKQNTSGEFLNVENSYYGTPKCIIFSVGEKFPEDDLISVRITGIKKNGVESPISYSVQMFNMFEHDFQTEYDVYLGQTINVATSNPIDCNAYMWSWTTNGIDVTTRLNSAFVTGKKVGKSYMRATKKNDGTLTNITVNVLPIDLELKYQLLNIGDGTYGLRLVLIADEDAVKNVDSATAWFTIPGEGDSATLNINRAYRSIIAAGKTVWAGEGKVFLLGKIIGIPQEMLNGVVGHFKFGNQTVDKTVNFSS